MTQTSEQLQFESENLRIGRIAALHPPLRRENMDEGVCSTQDPVILSNLANIVRIWSQARHDLPDDFCEIMRVTSVSRQPVTVLRCEYQFVERELAEIEEPCDTGQVDSRPWPTDDIFKIVPTRALWFPDHEQTETFDIPGRQERLDCPDCGAHGATTCSHCGGAGEVLCPHCGGACRVTCPRCDGGGTHIGASGNYIQCQACRTRGTVRCEACRKGQVVCTACRSGQVTCPRCQGFSYLRIRQRLTSKTHVTRQCYIHLSDPWPVDRAVLSDDAEQVDLELWEWPASSPPCRSLEAWLPMSVLSTAKLELDQVIRETSGQETKRVLSGVRLTLLGTYLHEVDIEWDNHRERLYVGGQSCKLFTARGRARGPSLSRRLATFGKWVVRQIMGEDYKPPVEGAYIRSVKDGTVHVTDTRTVVPTTAQLLGATAEVREQGYSISFAMGNDDGQRQPIKFAVTFDVDSTQRLLLCTRCDLGQAHRDRFPEALSASDRLTFGRIGVRDIPSIGQSFFEFLDCRPYEFVQAAHYAIILQTAVAEIEEMLQKNTLG